MAPSSGTFCKLVIRHLPPTLSEEEFKEAVDPLLKANNLWTRYVPGKTSIKGFRHSRAFLCFPDIAEALDFRAAFNGHTFVGERGQQFKCSVHFAIYQKVPKTTSKRDPREGTIEKDVEYQDFLKKLEKDPQALFTAKIEEPMVETKTENNGAKRVTSLMQFLADKWSGKHFAQEAGKRSRKSRGQDRRANSNRGSQDGTRQSFEANNDVPPGFERIPALPKKPEKPITFSRGEAVWNDEPSNGKPFNSEENSKDRRTSRSQKGKPPPKKSSQKGGQADQNESKGPEKNIPKMTILKRESEKPNRPSEAKEKGSKDVAKQGQKPARVRAGFQVYQPRMRTEEEAPK